MRIHQLTLASSNVAAQSLFYRDMLGLPVRECAGDSIEVALQASTIRFEPASHGSQPRYHFAINVPCGSIAEAADWVADRHELIAFHGHPDVEEGATIVADRSFYFLDPGGDVVELIANEQLDNDFGGRFGPDSLLEISEIGLATREVEATCAAIQEVLGADISWGGEPGAELTAIGDFHGVVIVAPVGRGWNPIGLPAQPLPTTIVAAAAKPRELTLPEGPYQIRGVADV